MHTIINEHYYVNRYTDIMLYTYVCLCACEWGCVYIYVCTYVGRYSR